MGQLFYGSFASPISLTDDLLAYVRLVTGTKLRNGESFMLSWHHGVDDSDDRSSLWIHPAIPIRFVFAHAPSNRIDPAALAHLLTAASGQSGLVLPESVDALSLGRGEGDPAASMQRGARPTVTSIAPHERVSR